jgi:hypothetical protein
VYQVGIAYYEITSRRYTVNKTLNVLNSFISNLNKMRPPTLPEILQIDSKIDTFFFNICLKGKNQPSISNTSDSGVDSVCLAFILCLQSAISQTFFILYAKNISVFLVVVENTDVFEGE